MGFGYRLNRFYIYTKNYNIHQTFLPCTFASLPLLALSQFASRKKKNPQITAKAIQELDSHTPTTSNWRRFFSSNPTCRRRSLISSLPIHPQIGGALISSPTRRRFNSSRTTRWHFFSAILNQQKHPQSSGSLFTYD